MVVRRGKEGEVRSECINKEMQAHLNSSYKEIMAGFTEEQEEQKKRMGINPRNQERLCLGGRKIYNLRLQEDCKAFLENVSLVCSALWETVLSEIVCVVFSVNRSNLGDCMLCSGYMCEHM